MADWEPQRPSKPASRWPAPEIYVNMEFGVSLSPRDPPHIASMKYASKNMHQRMYRPEREERQIDPHPPTLMPGAGRRYQRRQQSDEQRPSRLMVATRPPYERAGSAPPSISDRTHPINPVSPVSQVSPICHRSSMVIDPRERPLPPLPSRFRLGEDDLPWSVPTWYRPQEQEVATPSVMNPEPEERRVEDPQRERELEELHLAMMTVDSLNNDGGEPWTGSSVGDVPRRPRSLGWAVRSEPDPESYSTAMLDIPPPPYVVSGHGLLTRDEIHRRHLSITTNRLQRERIRTMIPKGEGNHDLECELSSTMRLREPKCYTDPANASRYELTANVTSYLRRAALQGSPIEYFLEHNATTHIWGRARPRVTAEVERKSRGREVLARS
ncbi:uncharacterized protein BP5553_09017 [Venustampulla echinocandica]|uniref:Uncharacterized protein n=1 Tax=Venustampulla echinocandica TaxID=2656787 RepID=A0A370TDQ5_9HELO|nr:uncharacterized protein BP5553_09017 [Venustampulla echinocandica]RDL32561.1 hypothetical protein BP5553_09017 [Venustampulla echinocandica]